MGLENRIGKIAIADFRDQNFDNWYESIQCLMEQIVIIRCDYLATTKEFEYVAYSHHFEEIEIGQIIPEYMITFDTVQLKDNPNIQKHGFLRFTKKQPIVGKVKLTF